MIAVQATPDFANAVLNHPAVRADVADAADGLMDVSPCIGSDNHLILGGEHGIFVVARLFVGMWECHTAILPSGRGEWALAFAQEGARYMFTATDCAEILTRVPQGHVAAAALTRAIGFRHQFTTPPECLFRGERVPCSIHSLSIQDWALRAPGMAERGAAFHDWLNVKLRGEPHPPDPDHNRTVGVAMDMIAAGQVAKGIMWYNRAALTARHAPISVIGVDPVQVRFDAGILTLRDGAISVEPCH